MSEASSSAAVPSIDDHPARQGAGRWWATTWYPGLADRMPGIDAKTLSVARHLAKRAANKPDGHCWPSLAEIMKATSLSRASVQRAIQALEIGGELYVQRGGPNHGCSHYWLLDLDEADRQEAIAAAKQAVQGRKVRLEGQKVAAGARRQQAAASRQRKPPAPRGIAPGQLELPVADEETSDRVVSEGRRVTPPPWCQRHHPPGVRDTTPPGVRPGITETPGGVSQRPGSSKRSSHPPNPEPGRREREAYRARRAAALERVLGEAGSA